MFMSTHNTQRLLRYRRLDGLADIGNLEMFLQVGMNHCSREDTVIDRTIYAFVQGANETD